MADQKTYTFLNPDALAKTLVLWLYIHIGANIAFGLASAIAFVEASGVDPAASKETPLTSDLLLGLVGIVLLLVGLATAFLALKWIYRVSRNAHASAKGLQVSPPWAIGWYFVPVAFLWKPFQALRETWQVSTRPVGWQTVATPRILRWWWGLLLVSNFVGQISWRISLMGKTMGAITAGAAFDVMSTFVDVPLDLVFIAIVRELTRKQVVEMTFGGSRPLTPWETAAAV